MDDHVQEQKGFKCKYCDRVFDKATSLGGHVSGAHSNMSAHFNYRQQIRNKFESRRQINKAAKELFYIMHPGKHHQRHRGIMD